MTTTTMTQLKESATDGDNEATETEQVLSEQEQQQQQQQDNQDADSATKSFEQEQPPNTERVLVIGVTGGIGSGKSTACRLLAQDIVGANRAVHLDADAIAHSLYTPGSDTVQQIQHVFGASVIDPDTGGVNRPALGAIVFRDASARQRLEQIVWPSTRQHVWKRLQEAVDMWDKNAANGESDTTTTTTPPVAIVEAALLLEANWNDWLDALWVVTASPEAALERLVQGERQLDPDDAKRRMQAQSKQRGIGNLDEEIERGVVSTVVDNSGSLEELQVSLQQALDKAQADWRNRKAEPQQRPQ